LVDGAALVHPTGVVGSSGDDLQQRVVVHRVGFGDHRGLAALGEFGDAVFEVVLQVPYPQAVVGDWDGGVGSAGEGLQQGLGEGAVLPVRVLQGDLAGV
jgi:hypothetical protein